MPPVMLGYPAPAFRLPLANGTSLELEAFRGEPCVIAFIDGVPPPAGGSDPALLERARGELRGLGAALLVFSGELLWCFRADDEMQILAGPGQLDPTAARRVGDSFGVGPQETGVFVIDGDGRVRVADVGPRDTGLPDFAALVDALAAAGRATVAVRGSAVTMTRRQVVLGSLMVAFAATALAACHRAAPPAPALPPSEPAPADLEITLEVNGEPRRVRIDPRTTLLDALRERLALTGTKKGCDQGQCGACTVLMDGRRIKSCLTLALAAEGSPVVTIEGLAKGDALHPMQAAFVAEDGFQCGYCTPGQIMSALGLLAEHGNQTGELSDEEIRERMSGNICRCGAYPNIVAAIQRARREGTRGI